MMTNAAVPKRIWGTLALFVLAVFLSACAEVNHLREAQATFNDTAELDNRLTLQVVDSDAATLSQGELETQVRTGYASVLLSLDKADKDQGAALKKHRLYGNMLMLRAMTQWRLGNLDAAQSDAATASKLPDEQIFPRDKGLALAMPGLIRNSQAYALIHQKPAKELLVTTAEFKNVKEKAYEEAIGLTSSAIDKYRIALDSVSGNHAVGVYLREAILAAHKNHLDAKDGLAPGKVLSDEFTDKVKNDLNGLRVSMCAAEGASANEALDAGAYSRIVSWAITLGTSIPENTCSTETESTANVPSL